jgi:hypothetical protein
MKLNFILDLDQTIISSEKIKRKEQKFLTFEVEENGLKVEKKISSNVIGTYHQLDPYYIVERPYLEDFLDFLFENFNVSVWTAGTKDYATFICKNVILKKNKPERKLNYFLYLEHCQMSSGTHVKNLNFLFKYNGFNKDNTILLDDSVDHINYKNKDKNAAIENSSRIIQAKQFFFLDQREDTFLKQLTEKLTEKLNKEIIDKKNFDLSDSITNINNYFKN